MKISFWKKWRMLKKREADIRNVEFDLMFVRKFYEDVIARDEQSLRSRMGAIKREIETQQKVPPSKSQSKIKELQDEAVKINQEVNEIVEVHNKLRQLENVRKQLQFQIKMLKQI